MIFLQPTFGMGLLTHFTLASSSQRSEGRRVVYKSWKEQYVLLLVYEYDEYVR